MKKSKKNLNELSTNMEKVNIEIKDIFLDIDGIFKELDNSEIFSGKISTLYHDRYLDLKNYFPKINYGLNVYKEILINGDSRK